MSLEAAMQQWWRRNGALQDAAPSERVFTEETSDAAVGVQRPYVVLRRGDVGASVRTTTALHVRDEQHFDVYADDLKGADQLARKIVRAYSRQAFSFVGGEVQDMKPAGREQRREQGIWRVRQTFQRRYRLDAA